MKISELIFQGDYELSRLCYLHSSSVKNMQSLGKCDPVVVGCLTECLEQAASVYVYVCVVPA